MGWALVFTLSGVRPERRLMRSGMLLTGENIDNL